MSRSTLRSAMTPYVPRVAAEWDLDHAGERWYGLEATSCLVDITGFTTISERLSRLGPLGAEQLTELLDHVFGHLLAVAYEKGGTLLKFGGDALLLAFARDDHPRLAVEAAVAMRHALSDARAATGVGNVVLRASMGLHSGTLQLFRVGDTHRELLVAGPDCSTTILLERMASTGEILVSEATAARLPPSWTVQTEHGHRVRTRRVTHGGPGILRARDVPVDDVAAWVPVRLRERLAERAGEAEHRAVSIAFVRYSGVDRLLERHGGEAVADALHEVVAVAQVAAEAEGVTMLASDADADGGKLILAAGVPVTQEDDEGRLLRAARAIADHRYVLDVHVGVNRGGVFTGDVGTAYRRTFTVIGDTVNVAARLAAAAPPGGVFTSAAVLERSHTAFDAMELGSLEVKGRRGAVATWSVGRAVGARHRARGSLPFRGRDAELGVLEGALERARGGSGGVAVVEGDRGSGKTRLVAELEARASLEDVLLVQGESFSAAVPYRPFRAAVRAVLGVTSEEPREAGRQLLDAVRAAAPDLAPLAPLLGPVVGGELDETPETEALAERFIVARTADVLVGVLEQLAPGVLLVVIEDAHWFDAASGELSAGLAAAARERPWLLCVTRRPTDAGLVPVAPDWRVELGPLADAAVAELVDAATAAAPLRPQHRDSLVEKANGNPLFVEELLRLLHEGASGALPDSLDAIAMREIDQLASDARRVVLVASVLGRVTDARLLRSLVGDGALRRRGARRSATCSSTTAPDGCASAMRSSRRRPTRASRSGPDRTCTVARGSPSRPSAAAMPTRRRCSRCTSRRPRTGSAPGATGASPRTPRAAPTRPVRCSPTSSAPPPRASTSTRSATRSSPPSSRTPPRPPSSSATTSAPTPPSAAPAGPGSRTPSLARGSRSVVRTFASEYQGRLAAAIRQVHAGVAILDAIERRHRRSATRVRAALLAREADVRASQGRLGAAIALARRAADAAEEGGDARTLALAFSLLDQALSEGGRADEAIHLAAGPRALRAAGRARPRRDDPRQPRLGRLLAMGLGRGRRVLRARRDRGDGRGRPRDGRRRRRQPGRAARRPGTRRRRHRAAHPRTSDPVRLRLRRRRGDRARPPRSRHGARRRPRARGPPAAGRRRAVRHRGPGLRRPRRASEARRGPCARGRSPPRTRGARRGAPRGALARHVGVRDAPRPRRGRGRGRARASATTQWPCSRARSSAHGSSARTTTCACCCTSPIAWARTVAPRPPRSPARLGVVTVPSLAPR